MAVKYIVYAIVGFAAFVTVGAMVLAKHHKPQPQPASVALQKTPACAESKNTPMGTVIAPVAGGYHLIWDQSCASGMRWVK